VYAATSAPWLALYPRQRPFHWAPEVRFADGGDEPLAGVSVYWNPAGHFHYVGLGLAEHGEKQSAVPDVSGWGCELTFRLAAPPEVVALARQDVGVLGGVISRAATQAPFWPVTLLNDVARYVFGNQAWLEHGHYIERPGAPLGLLRDLDLPHACETPNGRFEWLQLVLMTDEQVERLEQDDWSTWLARTDEADPGWRVAPAGSEFCLPGQRVG